MKCTKQLAEALNEARTVANKDSWFRGTPHYWAEASLPLAYAVACVEVVCERSGKARAIYSRIIETWGSAGIKDASDKICSIMPESEKEKVRNALAHPETELLPDPNRRFKDLEKLVRRMEVDGEFFGVEETAQLERLISEFVIVGFNGESDIEKGRYTVIPSEEAPWLIWAIAMRTILDSYEITFEKVRNWIDETNGSHSANQSIHCLHCKTHRVYRVDIQRACRVARNDEEVDEATTWL